MHQHTNPERGSSTAWTAIFLAFVLVPMLALVIDGSRLFYVRGRLQTAADAACEDAAWSGADYRTFRNTGQNRFVTNMGAVIGQAQSTFINTLGDRSGINFSAGVAITPDYARMTVFCSANASVPLAVMLGSTVSVRAQAMSAARFNR